MDESSSSGEGQRDASASRSEKRNFRLTREDRIRLSSEYRRVFKEGVRYRTTHFHIRMLRNSLGRARLGISAGKEIGIACARNRIKRRLREYFRLNRHKMPPETDMVFIALKGAPALDTHQLSRELDRFFERNFSS